MKKIYLLLIAFAFTSLGFSQIVAWEFDTNNGNEATVNATTLAANLNTSTISRGTGLTSSLLANAFSSTNFTASGTQANAITNNKFIAFQVSASAGFTVSLSTLDANFRRSSTGPDTFIWRYSTNGTTFTDIGSAFSYTSTATNGSAQTQINLSSITALQNVASGTTITFRLYGWGASATTGTFAIGRLAGNDLSIGGTVNSPACTPPTTQATAYNTTAIRTTTATLNWTRGNGSNVLVLMKQGGAVDADPANGTPYTANSSFSTAPVSQIGTGNYVVYNGLSTAPTVNVTNLVQNTNYHVAVYEYTSGTNCYRKIDKLTGNFNTLCTAVSSLPFIEDFEGGVVPPACWTTFRGTNNLGVVEDWKISASGEGRPANGFAAKINPETIVGTSQDWLVTPALDLNLTSNNQLTFYSKNNFVGDQSSTLSVRVSTTSQTDIATFSAPIETFTESGTTYMLRNVDLSAYDSNATVYVAFVMTQSSGDVWLVDDVEVSGDCVFPAGQATSFNASSIDADAGTATLSWVRGGGNNVLVVMKEASAVVEDPTSGLTYVSNPVFGSGDEIGTGNFVVYNGPATSVNISNLVQNTTYDVSIYEYNNTADCYNLTQLTGSFYVPCASFGLPFSEGFEGGTIPACWTTFENNGFGTENWTVDGAEPNNGSNFSAHMPFEFGTTPAGVSENWLVTPAIDLTSALYGELTFFSKDGDNSEDYGTVYTVRVSTMSQTTPGDFTTAATYDEIELGSVYNQKTINLNAYVGNVIYIAFVKEQDVDLGGDDWYLDDVSVTVPIFPTRSFWYEPFTNNAQYNVTAGGEGNDGTADYFQITDGININKSYTGNNGNFFAAQDIDDGGWAGSASPSVLEWTDINVSRYSSLNFSGKFASVGGGIDDSDYVLLEYQLDGGGWNNLIAFENDGSTFNTFFQEDTDFDGTGDGTPLTSAFQTFSKAIATVGSVLDLRITIALNSGDEDIALEDFRLVGLGTGFEGNAATGFGGVVGNATLEVLAAQAPTIDFKFNRGSADFNDYLVIYIDSKTGGITDTSTLTDSADDGRKAVSGFDGTQRSTVNFPPGFRPDYAISMNNGFAGLFEIVEGGSHNFIQSANLSPTGPNNASTYNFNILFSNIMTTPGLEGFKFLGTYLNGGNAFRSNESFGRNTAGASNPGVPSTMTMETYFQVASGLQGGIAPTLVTGPWSADTVWLNGNPPLATDQITVNQDVDQNIDVVALNGVTINAALDILDTYTLTTAGGLTGSGTLDVSGKLSITQGGFTTLLPSYLSGSTLEYKDITGTYNRFNEWTLGAAPSNVIIDNANLDLTDIGGSTATENFNIGNDLSLLNSGSINIDATKSLTVGNVINNDGGTVAMGSTSERYSSLIANSVSVTGGGTFNYNRHINGQPGVGVGTGANDLVSAPFSGQQFDEFRAANLNIRSNGAIDPLLALYVFGPFEKSSGTYLTWAGNNSTPLTPGVGYRAASTNNAGFTFTGTLNTGTITNNIVNSGAQFAAYNLIGNPYSSYMNVREFLEYDVEPGAAVVRNIDLMTSLGAIYGYDGDAAGNGSDGWIVYNLTTPLTTNITPGQGFLVTADAAQVATYDMTFTPSMRRIDVTGDFIPGRMADENNVHLQLQAAIGNSIHKTKIFFIDNLTSGMDFGYDAAVFGSNAPAKSIYSHLVQDNTGADLAIQALAYSELGSEDIIVPLGINVPQGQQVTVSISESDLPSNIEVYLEDNVAGTFTLLNTNDYVFTPSSNLNDTGRFFLRFTSSTLSNPEANINGLQIYTTTTPRALFIKGQLQASTTVSMYDIQGRMVLSSVLDTASNSNQVDVSSLSSGVYVVKLSNSAQQKTQKVIIK